MTDFHDLVETTGLTPAEETRLRRAHELLVRAGPPPDLPAALAAPPEHASEALQASEAEILQFPLLPRRRLALTAVVAAALGLIVFGGGFFLGHSKSKPAALKTVHVVSMHGQGQAVAVLRIAAADSVGNSAMDVQVSGLPKQKGRSAFYELWLTKNGKALAPCGVFRVHGKQTNVRFMVPYDLTRFDGWIVTAQPRVQSPPGPTVLT
jgi:hypothetical protein